MGLLVLEHLVFVLHAWLDAIMYRARFHFFCVTTLPFYLHLFVTHRLLVPRAVQPSQLSPAASLLWCTVDQYYCYCY